MTVQTINIGNQVNDGLGDDLRTAFEKVNANFTELESSLTVTASNLDGAGSSVFKQKTGTNLEFRKLVSGTKMQLNETPEAIIFNNTSPDAFTRIDTDSGSVQATVYPALTLQGTLSTTAKTARKDIEVTTFGSNVYFKTVLPVTDILTIFDFGLISGNLENIAQLALSSSNVDFGTITNPSRLNLDLGGIL